MTALAAVITLHPRQKDSSAEPAEPDLPEPVQLYGLTVLAFLLHVPKQVGDKEVCARCPEPWPCAHLRLAYRLREGF
ncbi:hypothetical protein [Lentzea sp. NPDC051838]|uniref:hypothetical protein n=1 Tax=Lentzea sp. NPDC051838 TaxID=3154849 RepID=UPI00342455F4